MSACDLCGGTHLQPVKRVNDLLLGIPGEYELQRCATCGLVFVNPRPAPEDVGKFYPSSYAEYQDEQVRKLRPWERVAGQPGGPKGLLQKLRVYIGGNASYQVIPEADRPGTILDIGCANGTFLDKMKLLGWTTHGFEMSAVAAEIARRKGHQVIGGLIDNGLPFADGTFDCIYCWHVMEHTFSPANTFKEINRLLKPGGQFVMAVPNYGSFQSRVFGRYWGKIEPPRHLFQFTRRTLHAYLAKQFSNIGITTRTGAASWWRCAACLANGVLGTKLYSDPKWLVTLLEIPAFLHGLFRYFGVGSDLRVTCFKAVESGSGPHLSRSDTSLRVEMLDKHLRDT